jgi:hypothetical protein
MKLHFRNIKDFLIKVTMDMDILPKETTEALKLIIDERIKQLKNFTPEHDDEHGDGSLAMAAATYAIKPDSAYRTTLDKNNVPYMWPWHKWYNPEPDDRIAELAKAGALILAEIERRKRANTLEHKIDEY